MAIYDYTVKDRKGNDVSLAGFKGKVLLIVNTATGCGFTPQYKGLEELWQKYHERGLEILDFPCDQFGYQAPGDDEEIHEFCQMKYKTSFDNFKKIEVNGENEIPLYTFLKSQQGFKGFSGQDRHHYNKNNRQQCQGAVFHNLFLRHFPGMPSFFNLKKTFIIAIFIISAAVP